MKNADLHIVAGHSNPQGFSTPPKLLREWVEHTVDSGATVHLVEHTTGQHAFEFSKDDPLFKHVDLIQIRGGAQHLLWLQYGMYNVGAARVPETANAIVFQDTDVKHLRSDWIYQTQHMLQHYRVGQTWTHAIDLDPYGNIAKNDHGNDVDRSFCAAWLAGEVDIKCGPYAPPISRALLPEKKERDWRSHTGYSNAIRPDVLAQLGRLPDWFIAGSSDYHMWHAFAGNLRQMVADQLGTRGYSPAYYRKQLELADLCDRVIMRDIGCVPGTIQHGWHGSKLLRLYGGREDILTESQFDPDLDITHDVHGLPMLTGRNLILRDSLRRYNARRNADCIRIDTV